MNFQFPEHQDFKVIFQNNHQGFVNKISDGDNDEIRTEEESIEAPKKHNNSGSEPGETRVFYPKTFIGF
jgi:hypothetical protein